MTISTLDVNSLKDSEIKDFLHSFIDKAKNLEEIPPEKPKPIRNEK